MEGSHGQLRTGFTDRLCRNDSDCFADLHRLAGRHVRAVALGADSVVAFAGQYGTDLYGIASGLLEDVHDSLGPLRGDHVVRLHNHFAGIRIRYRFCNVSSGNPGLKGFNGIFRLFLAVFTVSSKALTSMNGMSLAFAAVPRG
jgi:hypothetical protein